MGIIKLTGYLLNSRDVSDSWDADFRLRNTRLVIDGNGLLFEIFGPSRGSSIQCGGEYARFHANVCSFFEELNANGVRSLVVLDGHSCRRPPKHGEAKIWDQAMSHLKRLQEVSSKEAVMKNQHSILPLWAKTVFIEALIACNVALVRSDGEADRTITELACFYRCPVMSGDSDFFLSDLPGGLVHFRRLNFHHPCAATARPILYRRALFVRALKRMPSFRYNTKRQIETFLKLAGALSGNTHVPVEQVRELYYGVRGGHAIIKALYWLLNRLRAASPEAALAEIRPSIDAAAYQGVLYSLALDVHMPIPGAHAEFRGIYHQQVYLGDTAVNAAESTRAVSPPEDTDGSLESACPWLFESYHFGLMGAVALFPCSDSRPSKLSQCVEADGFGSCSKFDRPLRALLLAMFSKDTIVSEVVYVGGQRTEVPLEPLLGVAPDISEVPELSVRERHRVLLHALHSSTSAMENVPTSLQLAVASLRYLWCRSRHEDCDDQPQVTERHLKALLAGVINGADQGLRWGAAGPPGAAQSDVIEARRRSLQDWCSDRYENTESSWKDATNDFDFSCQWDREDIPELHNEDIHVFNAWQRIVGTAIYINHTLKQPLPTPLVHELYDGVQVCELYYHARQDDILAGTRNPVLAENLWSAIIRADES